MATRYLTLSRPDTPAEVHEHRRRLARLRCWWFVAGMIVGILIASVIAGVRIRKLEYDNTEIQKAGQPAPAHPHL
jgi:hypothetical protein